MLSAQNAVEQVQPRAVGEAPAPTPAASEYALMRARLGNDIRRLREIQSVERKIELKRALLPDYDAWVAGVLDADTGAEDDVLTHVMIWRIDIDDFDRALDLADYVIRHKLTLPERFDRTAGTLVAEEIAVAALKSLSVGGTFDIAILERAEALTEGEDMPDQAKAKLVKAIAILTVRAAEAIDPAADGPAGARIAGMQRALYLFRRAYGLSHIVGVKKDIDRLERELKKVAQQTAQGEGSQGEGSKP